MTNHARESGTTEPEKPFHATLVDNLYEWPVEYYKEAAYMISSIALAYEDSRKGDPNDRDTQYENLRVFAAKVKEALDGR